MTLDQQKPHIAAIRAQARKILELHTKYHVSAKDLAKRFDCSAVTIQHIISEEKKKKLLADQGPKI